jgi:peptidoglycan/LPS O-acetylase OafA/YrhL
VSEIRALTGIRGVAALIVVWYHIRSALEARGLVFDVPSVIERVFLSGGHSVDVFFVLSGFILTLTYDKWFAERVTGERYLTFMRRRLARIYPLHFAMLLLSVALVTLARSFNAQTVHDLGQYDYGTLPQHFLLVHSWGFLSDEGNWNPPSWSISIELMAYLVLPPFLLLTSAFSKKNPWAFLLPLALLGFILNLLLHWGLSGVEGLSRGLSEFFIGCATTRLLHTKTDAWLRSTLGSWVAFVGLTAACAVTPYSGFIVGFATVPLLLALCGEAGVSRFFAWRPIYFLGEISYSIYLGHFLFSAVLWRLVRVEWMKAGTLNTILGLLLVNAFIIVLSTLTYYAIERPGRTLLSGSRAPRPVSSAANANVPP